MKINNVRVNAVYKNNGILFKDLMREILQSEVIINSILKSNNINLKVVDGCQKREKRSV